MPWVSSTISRSATNDRIAAAIQARCAASQIGPKNRAPQAKPSGTSTGSACGFSSGCCRSFTAPPWWTGSPRPPAGRVRSPRAWPERSALKQASATWWALWPARAGDVQRDHRVERQRAEELLEQFGVHVADLGAFEIDVPGQERAAGDVDRGLGQRLIHRDQRVAEPADAALVAERLGEGRAEDDADVLGGVVEVDMQVALGADRQVEQAVPGAARSACDRGSRCRWRCPPLPVPSRSSVRLIIGFRGFPRDGGNAGHDDRFPTARRWRGPGGVVRARAVKGCQQLRYPGNTADVSPGPLVPYYFRWSTGRSGPRRVRCLRERKQAHRQP